jgi:hypothetical protein
MTVLYRTSMFKVHIYKVIGGKLLHTVPGTYLIKVKTPFFCHFFVDNFFRMSFYATFSTDSKSALNSALFTPILLFWEKNFLSY